MTCLKERGKSGGSVGLVKAGFRQEFAMAHRKLDPEIHGVDDLGGRLA